MPYVTGSGKALGFFVLELIPFLIEPKKLFLDCKNGKGSQV